MRSYKGWTIYNPNIYGYWVANRIHNGYLEELKADTLTGLKQFITDVTDAENN